MKPFTAKQRAAIYLEAAKAEAAENKGSIYKLRYATGINRSIENLFPEIVFFNKDKVTTDEFSNYQIRSLRILALLFAREIALNP